MLKALRSTLRSSDPSGRPVPPEYQAVSVGDEVGPEPTPSEDPRRHGPRVYWCFWVLGAAVLLGWNVLICSLPLFASFFEADHPYKASLASYLSTTYCFGNLLFLGIAQRDVSTVSPASRMRGALMLLNTTLAVTLFPVLPFLLPSLSGSPNLLLGLLGAITLALGCSTAYLQSATFALASLWGSQEVLAVMSGQGGIAVLVSGAQLVLALVAAFGPSAPVEGLPDPSGGPADGSSGIIAGVGLWSLAAAGTSGCFYALRKLRGHNEFANVMMPHSARMEDNTAGKDKGLTRSVLRKNKLLELSAAWVFVVTLAAFPAITTTIVSVQYPTPQILQPNIFIPLHFLVANVGDYIGRTYLPAVPALFITSQPRVMLLSLARTLFIPMFLACNVGGMASHGHPPFINSDIVYFLILAFFFVTNGWVSSLSMILASSPTLNPHITEEEKDVAGTLAAFCLVAGLAVGSVASFGVGALVHGR